MAGEKYFDTIGSEIVKAKETQLETISKAAEIIAESIAQGGLLHIFGTGHSQALVGELFYRAGGLVPINALLEPSLSIEGGTKSTFFGRLPDLAEEILKKHQVSPDEVIIIISTSGRNAVSVEMAMAAKDQGLTVIALTSLPYSRAVKSRHSNGKKLYQLADVVLDNKAPYGDAAIELLGSPYKVGPTSTVVGMVILWALMVEIVEILIAKKVKPEIWLAGNVPGGDEAKIEYLNKYRHRIRNL